MSCLAKDASQKQIIIRLIGFGGDGLANLLESFRISSPGIEQLGPLGQQPDTARMSLLRPIQQCRGLIKATLVSRGYCLLKELLGKSLGLHISSEL
jgi:hypothetical protein